MHFANGKIEVRLRRAVGGKAPPEPCIWIIQVLGPQSRKVRQRMLSDFSGRGTIGSCQQSYGLPSVANGLSHGLRNIPPACFLPAQRAGRPFKSLGPKAEKVQHRMVLDFFWQGHKDLNPEPTVLETAALPIELYPYMKRRDALLFDGGPSGIRTRDYPVMSRRL